MPPVTRQRKTKQPCDQCFLHPSRCICALIPKLSLKTRVTLIIHAKELKRTTNTGRLALLTLTNSGCRIRGERDVKLELTDLLDPQFDTLMLYPSDSATVLDANYLKRLHRPIHLLVPDGNWRQASKLHYRHKELHAVPRVTLAVQVPTQAVLRKESVCNGMATLQAIALALGVIEGEAVGNQIMSVYNNKLHQTLQGRGVR